MPVTTEDRAVIKHMDQPAKDNMLQEQLKRISIAVNSGTLDRGAVNDALDHIEVITAKESAKDQPKADPAKTDPAPGTTFKPAATQPAATQG